MHVTRWVPFVLALLLAACVVPQPEVSPLSTPTSAAIAGMTTSQPVVDATPSATPALAQPDPTKATFAGVVLSSKEIGSKPLAETAVRLARVYWNADKSDGAFVLEGATSPSAISEDDGSFILTGIPPADYVIVIGDPAAKNSIVLEASGKARIITLQPGKKLDIGKIVVRAEPQ